MNSRYNKSFEENLRNRLDNEELPFDEGAWEMMETKLDNKVIAWYRSKGFMLGVSMLGLLVIGGVCWNLLITDNKNQLSHHQNSVSEIAIEENLKEVVKVSNINLEKNEENVSETILDKNSSKVELIKTEKVVNKNDRTSSVDQDFKTKQTPTSESVTSYNTANIPANKTTSDSDFVFNLKRKTDVTFGDHKEGSYSKTTIYDKVNIGDILNNKVKKKGRKNTEFVDDKKNYIKKFSMLQGKESKLEDVAWMLDDPEMAGIEEYVDVPKHYITASLGFGMANLEIDAPSFGDLKPLANVNRETYLSLAYLYKPIKKIGLEVGLQVQLYSFTMSKYFEEGSNGLEKDYYQYTNPHSQDVQSEPFVNLHFYQKINRRLEIDLYGGFYAMRLLEGNGSYGGGGSNGRVDDNWLISYRVEGKSGIEGGGRLKFGANFNILTSKLNTVGVGFAYTHNLYGGASGTYSLLSSVDNTVSGGNLRTNGNGFKIQLNYGFGMSKNILDIRYMDKKEVFGEKNFFMSFHFGIRSSGSHRVLNNCITGDCINFYSPNHEYLDFSLGHYISDKWALGIGLGFQNVRHFVPFDSVHELYSDMQVFNIPTFIQYDFFTKGKLNFYGQFGPSFDFKRSQDIIASAIESYHPRLVDEDKLQVNIRTAIGADFKLYKGLYIGVDVKRQIAFDYLFEIEKDAAFDDSRILRLGIKNTYFMGGLNLKYQFTN